MSLMGIPWDFMYKIMTFKVSKPRLSPSCSCWWNLLAIFHLCSPFLSWYVNTHMHIYIHIHTHIFTCAHVYTYVHTCVHMCRYTYVYACMHACLHALCAYMLCALCTHACTYAYVHMNTHICEHTHTQPKTMPPATRCWVTGLLSLPHPISLFMSQIRTKPLGN